VWAPSKSKRYSIKSGNRIYCQGNLLLHPPTFISIWKKLWNSNLYNLHKLLLWKIMLGTLPTSSRLYHIFHIHDVNCIICGGSFETSRHLFLQYPLATFTWLNSKSQIKLDYFWNWSIYYWIDILLDPHNLFPIPKIEREEMIQFAKNRFGIIETRRQVEKKWKVGKIFLVALIDLHSYIWMPSQKKYENSLISL
jgi:hypothetical protein